MANAAFDAWVVKFLTAVEVYNKNANTWNAAVQKNNTQKILKPDSSYNAILTLRTELSSILSYNPALRSAALNNLDRIINIGGIKNGKYQPLYIIDVKSWISKYSILVR
jgi:hypothetical protein